MKKKNQLADLRRLISLPPAQMRKLISQYLYEKPSTVIKMLFRLIHTEKLTKQKTENIITLTKFLLDQHAPTPIPEWLLIELERLLFTDKVSKVDKAIIFSAFNPEELLEKLKGFEEFIEEFTEFRESFSDYLIEQLSVNPSLLNEVYQVIIEKSKPDGLFAMIDDLSGSDEPEILKFLEVLTYYPDKTIAYHALKAIEHSKTQDAIRRLYNISCLNKTLKQEAEEACIYLMYQLPPPSKEEIMFTRKSSEEYLDLWVSLIDGNGAMTVFIAKKFGRNKYFISSILMKMKVGIKEVILMSDLPRDDYKEIKEAYFSELSYYPVDEEYIKTLVKHFLKIGERNSADIPIELIILKNILDWDDLEPIEYIYELPQIEPIKYYPREMFQFPFETWWLHEKYIYELLKPYKNKKVYELPDTLFYQIVERFTDYAKREIVPKCELCADIIRRCSYQRRTRQLKLYMTIRDEILNTDSDNYHNSHFLSFGIITTIENILHNLSLGIESPEDIE